MEITSKDERGSAPVLDIDSKSTVGGGVEDVYGEDRANEDQPVTRWTISVASGYTLLRDPHYNKGLAFTERERCSLLAWSVTTRGYNSTTSSEENDAQYSPISSSTSEVHGHDGSSGEE
ncbi:hypothetical protein CsSME_00051004 [Camellia sinensis var. sinensis]